MSLCLFWARRLFAAASLFVICGSSIFQSSAASDVRNRTVELSAFPASNPPSIQLEWVADPKATGYALYRRVPGDKSWAVRALVGAGRTNYTDTNVTVGASYEYRVVKPTTAGYTGVGYALAGIETPLIEGRGQIALFVDANHAAPLASELERLRMDLVGDGWTVIRHNIPAETSAAEVRAMIQDDYDADPEHFRSVFIIGHVAVPRSGNIAPDGIAGHRGAWPADAFYADVDGEWTDSTANTTAADSTANWNTPEDGKFDQDLIPADLKLEVGRVDFSNLPIFTLARRDETGLLRQYLDKDHDFRQAKWQLPRRALICDSLGETAGGEALAGNAWRNFAPMFGATNSVALPANYFVPALKSGGFLWSFASGPGTFTNCVGVVDAADFARSDFKTAFMMLIGSHFGDWDTENNLLRSALGSESFTLAAVWAGRPDWFFHPMALGETIGHSALITQNHDSAGDGFPNSVYGSRMVHTSLLGDPSLRLHPVRPAVNVKALAVAAGLLISWSPSADAEVEGYHLYRAKDSHSAFSRITPDAPVNGNEYVDAFAEKGNVYMVRAIKLESSASGSYYNASQGAFLTNTFEIAQVTKDKEDGVFKAAATTAPTSPASLTGSALTATQVKLNWTDRSSNESGFQVYRKTGSAGTYAQLGVVGANIVTYTDTTAAAATTYYYKVRAYNSGGSSSYTSEIAVTTPALPVAPSSLAGVAQSAVQISISWKDNSANETGFRVYRKVGASGAYSVIATTAANATSYVNAGLNAGASYYYRVSAINANGESALSNEINVNTPPLPATPGILGGAPTSTNQIALKWGDNSTDETGFKLMRKTSASGTYTVLANLAPNTTIYTDSNLTPGGRYYYTVYSVNSLGTSLPSNEIMLDTPTGDATPYVVNVKSYGAKGDGVTDDTAAFNAAKSVGRKIFVPAGVYRVNLSLDGLTSIQGDSRRGTTLKPANPAMPVLTVCTMVTSDKDLAEYSDLNIDCELAAGSIGILLGSSQYAGNSRNTFRNLIINKAGLYGIWVRDATSCYFESVYVQDGYDTGIYIDSERNTQVCQFVNCQFRQNRVGAHFCSGNRYDFTGCDFESNRETGLYIERRISSGFAHSSFSGCWLENNGWKPGTPGAREVASIYFDGYVGMQLTNASSLIFTTCGISSAAGAWDISSDRAQNALFDRCSFSLVADGGFSPSKLRYSAVAEATYITLRQCAELNRMASPDLYVNFPALSKSASGAQFGFFFDYDYNGRRFTNRRVFGLGASPVGALTPGFEGEVVTDDSTGNVYVAKGITDADWVALQNTKSGTYTPVITGSTLAGVGVYTTAKASYVKVGPMVTVTGRISYTGHTGLGTMQISLPFPAEINPGVSYPAMILSQTIPFTNVLGGTVSSQDSVITLKTFASGALASLLPMSPVGTIDFSVTYRAQ